MQEEIMTWLDRGSSDLVSLSKYTDCDNTSNAELERKRRKREQNRNNQRARRNRIRNYKPVSITVQTEKCTFQVQRWRRGEVESVHFGQKRNAVTDVTSSFPHTVPENPTQGEPSCIEVNVDNTERISNAVLSKVLSHSQTVPHWTSMPLLADRVLHLINFNVLRVLAKNKAILASLSIHFTSCDGAVEVVDITKRFPVQSTIGSSQANIPLHLRPTALQATIPHPSWIGLIPFPAMRDNLILRQHLFDHKEFMRDIIGDMINLGGYSNKMIATNEQNVIATMTGMDDEITNDRKGLILWSEPFHVESWEAAPGFLRKWGWTLKGCEKLVQSTNYWRMVRGETPVSIQMY